MAEVPELGESNYPRGEVTRPYGSADRLEALGRAYVGLTWLGVVNIVLTFGVRDVFVEFQLYALPAVAGMLILSSALSFWPARNLAITFEWPSGMAYLCAFLLGLQSVVCCGVFGILGVMIAISSELNRYGMGTGHRGFRSSWLRVAVARRREQEARASAESRPNE